MRVLFVSQEFPPETGWGGIGTYVDVLSEALVAKGVDVHVLSVVDGQPASTRERGGVTVHRRPLPHVRGAHRPAPEVWWRAWLALNTARLAERLGIEPDVVECPEWMAEGLALGLRGTFPLVVRLHSTARQVFPHSGQGAQLGGLDGGLAMWLEESSARRANVVVSTRPNLDEVARSMRLDPAALHAIPYPVRQLALIPMPDPRVPRVTFVGRLEPRKAPEVVLRAAPAVLDRLPNVRFTFVGRDGVAAGLFPSAEWLSGEAERLGVAHAVELTGHLDRSGLLEQLGSATVCAFPSRWESFGNVLAEASSAGRPVVASTIPPFTELVDDGGTGRLAPLDDTTAWAQALLEILSDSERARAMGRPGPGGSPGSALPSTSQSSRWRRTTTRSSAGGAGSAPPRRGDARPSRPSPGALGDRGGTGPHRRGREHPPGVPARRARHRVLGGSAGHRRGARRAGDRGGVERHGARSAGSGRYRSIQSDDAASASASRLCRGTRCMRICRVLAGRRWRARSPSAAVGTTSSASSTKRSFRFCARIGPSAGS